MNLYDKLNDFERQEAECGLTGEKKFLDTFMGFTPITSPMSQSKEQRAKKDLLCLRRVKGKCNNEERHLKHSLY